jgi:serine/threonine-protein kinase
MDTPATPHDSQSFPTPVGGVAPNSEPRTVPSESGFPSTGDMALKATALLTPSRAEGPALALPREFGKYVLLEKLGHGGFGIVYKANDTALGRTLALKQLRGGPAAGFDEAMRFLREAKAVANLKHRHVIAIHDFGQIDGQYYFTMELVERGSLTQHLSRFAGDIKAAVTLMEKVARAVHHIHGCNLLHRDLKPGNILLDDADEPIVSDFGLAKQLEPTEDALTNTGEIPGTPAYMSPEQTSGSSPPCPQTDVWALGIILFEIVCGRKPFQGPSREKISDAILKSEPPEPRSLQPRVDRELEAIILKCLAKKPADRYATASDLADDLARWQRGEPTAARPLPWLFKAARRHRRGLAMMVVLASLVLVGSVAALRLDPDLALKTEIMPKLERGESVTLLGETGKPLWSKWILPGTEAVEDGKPYAMHSGNLSLLELLPRLPMERFQFHAEVRHHRDATGRIGIYFCRTKHALTWGELHGFFAVTFADWGRNARDAWTQEPRGEARMNLYLHSKPSRVQFHHQLPEKPFVPWLAKSTASPELPRPLTKEQWAQFEEEQIKKALADQGQQWRRLTVKVDPESVRWYWEGELAGTLQKKDRLEHARTLTFLRPILEGKRPEFPPEGGLGLYVERTNASFRNVVVEPLVE